MRRAQFGSLIHFAYTSYTSCGIRLRDGEPSTNLPVTCWICLAEVGKYSLDAAAQMSATLQQMAGVLNNFRHSFEELQRTTKERIVQLESPIQKKRSDHEEDP